jgi:hypothetical protein
LFLKTTLLALLTVLLASSVGASDMRIPSYFNYPRFKVVSDVERGKEAEFELTFMPVKWLEPGQERTMAGKRLELYPTDTTDMTMRATVTVQGYSGVFSTEILTVGLIGDSTQTFTFSAMIPDLDTVRVGIVLKQAGATEERRRYFVWNGDEMELRLMNPRRGPDKPDYKKIHPLPPPTRVGSRPVHDSLIAHTINAGPVPDSAAPSEAALRKVRELEKEPLIDVPYQRVKIGYNIWVRWRGDKEFLLNPTIEQRNARQKQIRDSLAALPDDRVVKIVLELPDSVMVKRALEVVGPLPPPTVGFQYVVEGTNAQLRELRAAGIYVEYWEVNPIRPRQQAPTTGQ